MFLFIIISKFIYFFIKENLINKKVLIFIWFFGYLKKEVIIKLRRFII